MKRHEDEVGEESCGGSTGDEIRGTLGLGAEKASGKHQRKVGKRS